MKKKFFIPLALCGLVVIAGIGMCLYRTFNVSFSKTDLKAYITQFDEGNCYLSENGYIPNAKAAREIGSCIIDNMVGSKSIGFVNIEYDEINHLWKVSKGYLFNNGGFVVMDQYSGKVVKALMYK